ncbi:glycosyltransferase [Curtobacterium sp. NPDC086286]|uniref:glycosyltransferase n=1 Tax=Curtobacterium sp. NPDC086286 TaxID=3363964 RepID=UPI003816587C
MIDLLFSDPIPVVQHHYQRQLHDVFASGGGSATQAHWSRPVEGFPGALDKARMLANAVHNLRRQRAERRPVLQAWPSLGLLETRLWSSPNGPRYVMLHDPAPLRRQYGHSERSRRWAAAAPAEHRPTVLVSNDHAFAIARQALPHHRIESVLHPMLSTRRHVDKTARPSILVAGQYKPARNVELLAALGPRLRARGWETTIVGRGWPEIEGWTVENRFVAEHELEHLLGRSWVHLLTYRQYFQSGVSLRAVEMGTPTVGEDTDFLRGLFGAGHPGLVATDGDAAAYERAIEAVIDGEGPSLETVQSDYFARCTESWRVVR